MRLITRYPAPPLADFVQCLWFYEASGGEHGKERLLPDGTMELVIDLLQLGPASAGGGVIIGAHAESFFIETSRAISVIGAHFRPGGAFPFLRSPAGEFHGVIVSFEEVWRARARELCESLLESASPIDRLRILERFLRNEVCKPLTRHPAVAFGLNELAASPAPPAVAAVIETYRAQPQAVHRAVP